MAYMYVNIIKKPINLYADLEIIMKEYRTGTTLKIKALKEHRF